MKFNVILDKEQLEEIANITADKVWQLLNIKKVMKSGIIERLNRF